MEEYLQATPLLDFSHPAIQGLLGRLCANGEGKDKILAIYNYVRDEIAFGYNVDDALPASRVLQDGYGQCNTKGILFMALLRGAGVPCRIHGFTIHKALQRGTMTGLVYKTAPEEIIHSWVEVWHNGQWLELEGFILDMPYLAALQAANPGCTGSFCGYGVAITSFQNPPVHWRGGNTYIQKEGIQRDFGLFSTPDEFFALHGQPLGPVKRLLYRHVGRHLMNRNVQKIRK